MKRILLVAGIALLSMGVYAQVGINTKSPKGTLDVSYDTEWAKTGKAQGVIPPRITIVQRNAMQKLIAGLMIYNTDYNCLQVFNGTAWSCTDGTHQEVPPVVGGATATLGSIDPLRWVALRYQGTYYNNSQSTIAPNGSVSVEIPYSNATNGAYAAYEQTFTLPDKNGIQRQFKLSYPAGSISRATGTITATLTNMSGAEYMPQPQSINSRYQDLATTEVTFNGTGATPFKIQAIGGIPDRCYDKTTRDCVGYGANVKEHQFIYMPIKGPDGKTWLNNNLGANYANVNSPVFNPAQQATTQNDYNAFGSLFQWQRNPDGHELIDWSSASNGAPIYGTSSVLASSWTNAGTNKYISPTTVGHTDYTWMNGGTLADGDDDPNAKLWRGGGVTNPCPQDFHVPTKQALYNVGRPFNYRENRNGPYLGSLRMPLVTSRPDVRPRQQYNNMFLWTSSLETERSPDVLVYLGNNPAWQNLYILNGHGFGNTYAIRCVQD